jgi:hypothetical protein
VEPPRRQQFVLQPTGRLHTWQRRSRIHVKDITSVCGRIAQLAAGVPGRDELRLCVINARRQQPPAHHMRDQLRCAQSGDQGQWGTLQLGKFRDDPTAAKRCMVAPHCSSAQTCCRVDPMMHFPCWRWSRAAQAHGISATPTTFVMASELTEHVDMMMGRTALLLAKEMPHHHPSGPTHHQGSAQAGTLRVDD